MSAYFGIVYQFGASRIGRWYHQQRDHLLLLAAVQYVRELHQALMQLPQQSMIQDVQFQWQPSRRNQGNKLPPLGPYKWHLLVAKFRSLQELTYLLEIGIQVRDFRNMYNIGLMMGNGCYLQDYADRKRPAKAETVTEM